MYRHLLTPEWIEISNLVGAGPLAPLVQIIQDLAGLDAYLLSLEKKIVGIEPDRESERLIVFDEANSLSHLWVLSAYEVIRTVSEFYNPNKNEDAPELSVERKAALASAKRKFEEIRMPLAKLQRRRESVYIFPWPILFPGSGEFGWEIGGGAGNRHFILRKEISKAWFDGLSTFRMKADQS